MGSGCPPVVKQHTLGRASSFSHETGAPAAVAVPPNSPPDGFFRLFFGGRQQRRTGKHVFQGMGPITSKSLRGWQRIGDDAPSARALYIAYGVAALAIGVFLFLWLG